jgi:ABC-2 type transport system ATP-binding protein
MTEANAKNATALESPAHSGDYFIETRGLTRYFGSRKVVDMLDLRVPRGCVYAFLGRNGSGKTTTLRMVMGLLEPTRGSASVLGHDSLSMPPAVRARIGYMSESHFVYRWMKVRECAAFQSRFYPRWNGRIFDAVIDHFRLSRNAKAAHLSRGERAGLSLALTLAPEPELVILDDPAIGLDPAARRSLLESMVYVTRRSDRTIFFSSHLLSDVERVADYIGVLDRSVLRVSCPVDVFRERVRQFVIRFPAQAPPLPAIPGLLHAQRSPGELRLTIANPDESSRNAMDALAARSGAAAGAVVEMPVSLEEGLIGYLGERGEKHFFLEDATDLEGAVGQPDERGIA